MALPRRRTWLTVGATLSVFIAIGAADSGAFSSVGPVAPATMSLRSMANSTVAVTVSDTLRFVPDVISVTPGAPVTISVEQLGTIGHTFTLASLSSSAGGNLSTSDTPAQVFAFLRAHPPLVNLSIPSATGSKVSATFTAPAAGIYLYFCTVPGHFQAGMHGSLYSGVSPPPPSSPNSTGAQGVIGIAGGVMGLVTLGIVLGFVFGRRPGSKHEMAPERLGYPELPPSGPQPPPGNPP
jgi:plastocyanin